jgi:hypothetical protein
MIPNSSHYPNAFRDESGFPYRNSPFSTRLAIAVTFSPASEKRPTARWVAKCKKFSVQRPITATVPSEEGPIAAAEKLWLKLGIGTKFLPLSATYDQNSYIYVMAHHHDEAMALANSWRVPEALLLADDIASFDGRESELTAEKLKQLIKIAKMGRNYGDTWSPHSPFPRRPIIANFVIFGPVKGRDVVKLTDQCKTPIFSVATSVNVALASAVAAGWPMSEALKVSIPDGTLIDEEALREAKKAYAKFW